MLRVTTLLFVCRNLHDGVNGVVETVSTEFDAVVNKCCQQRLRPALLIYQVEKALGGYPAFCSSVVQDVTRVLRARRFIPRSFDTARGLQL